MMTGKRIASLDAIRGLALMFILLFHSSIYNFANIHKLDFSHPPILIVLMSFMALWGGVFIIYSLIVNSVMVLRRSSTEPLRKTVGFLVLSGFIYLILHYLLNIFLGRWNIDFVNNRPNLTFIAGTLRNMHLAMPPTEKLYEGSSLSTIAWNLILVSTLLYFLLRNDGIRRETRNYLILGIGGSLIMLGSFVRVSIFPAFTASVESGNFLLSTFFSFTLANPYPLLPYLAYGLFGAMAGLMFFTGRRDLMKKVLVPAGIFFLMYGIAGMVNFDKTISKPDYFWYFKTHFELGVFLLIGVWVMLGLETKTGFLKGIPLVRWFGRISLTIYLLETTLSEILRIILHQFRPDWDQTINSCLLFGLINILVWSVILFSWRKIDFRYSLEYFWVRGFSRLGKGSTKLDFEKL